MQEYVAPANVVSSPNNNLATMLLAGEIDAAIAPGPVDAPDIRPLFPESRQADDAWHRRTGIYPISHLLVVKDAALASHPGLATELFHLFNEARSQYLRRLRSGAADDAGYGECSDHCCCGPSNSSARQLRMSRPIMPRPSSITRYRPRKARFRNRRSSTTTGAELVLPLKPINS